MKLKWVFCLIFVSLSVLKSPVYLHAANTGQIDGILKKSVLDDQDKKEIDNYIKTALNTIINERDLTKIARHRESILSRKGSQAQYVDQFNNSLEKYLPETINTANNLRPAERQAVAITNLLILIDNLENVKYALIPLAKLEDENVIVRYWAVRCLTNPAVITQLNAGKAGNPNLIKEITEKFINIVPKSNPEILNFIARYAAAINIPEGQKLLLQIVDKRIKDYADWNVSQENIDGTILMLLESKITNPSSAADVPVLAQRFAQLYSYIIQRYVKGIKTLREDQKNNLITAMVETEDKCIGNMTGAQQNLRKAIEQNQTKAIMDEHDKLMGSETSRGLLPAKYSFDYGKTDTGSARNAPIVLSDPK
jgi:hypothetical protein